MAPSKKRRVTLADVAREAQVSSATASLALRDSDAVAEKTRQRVLEAAQKLNYVYNFGAASLRTQRSYMVALILRQSGSSSGFWSELTLGVQTALEQAGYTVMLTVTYDDLNRQIRALETTRERQLDGLILLPSHGTPMETLQDLRDYSVVIVSSPNHIDLDYVGPDYTSGMDTAVTHLLKCGHKRIAFVGGEEDMMSWQQRLAGYQRAWERAGYSLDKTLLKPFPANPENADALIREILASDQDLPHAFVCYNDSVAFGLMSALQDAGIQPGSDVGIVGFDNIQEAALWRPTLTTLSASPHYIGERAAELLLKRIDDPEKPIEKIIFSPQLIVRDSCGCRKQNEKA